jgi:hypothetical protein
LIGMADQASRERLFRALAEADRIEDEIIALDRKKDAGEIERLSSELRPTSGGAQRPS